jgi:ATP-dependent phosphofructokinase / diphosphate-dependent phosphofructokinase
MRIGVLTGGGDCPGLNAVLRGIVKRADRTHGHSLVGFRQGWRGVAEGQLIDLTRADVRDVLARGGTLLGTSRYHPHEDDGGMDRVLETLRRERIEGLICIGGDGTLNAAGRLVENGARMVCVPKTIDNDVFGTDRSVGFDTAVSIATEAIDRVHTTAESHNRVMVVEVMGHHAGWIAVCAGIAGGADIILNPEDPFDIDEVCAALRHRHRAYASYSIVVVAEGAVPREGTLDFTAPTGPYGSIVAGATGERLKDEIQQRTGFEARVTVLGHVQRGGSPTATDRLLGSRFGVAAADAIGTADQAVMTALVGEEICLVPVSEIAGKLKLVPEELRRTATSLL